MIESILAIIGYGAIGSWGIYEIVRCLNGRTNNSR